MNRWHKAKLAIGVLGAGLLGAAALLSASPASADSCPLGQEDCEGGFNYLYEQPNTTATCAYADKSGNKVSGTIRYAGASGTLTLTTLGTSAELDGEFDCANSVTNEGPVYNWLADLSAKGSNTQSCPAGEYVYYARCEWYLPQSLCPYTPPCEPPPS